MCAARDPDRQDVSTGRRAQRTSRADLSQRAGEVIADRFVLARKLGAGGFGSVWLAADRETRSEVALKILHPAYRQKGWVLDRFLMEAKILANLDHPNITRPFAYRGDGDHVFLAMEYIDGVTLEREIAERVKQGRHFAPDEVAHLFSEICSAVGYAHSHRVVHRDLKPRNVMLLRRDDRVEIKILDFGVAKILIDTGTDSTTVGRLLGSLLYMSPEQVRGTTIDGRADIFGLGTILFELLTLCKAWARDADGRPIASDSLPVRRDHLNNHVAILRRIAIETRPRASDSRAEISPRIDDLLATAMAIDPADRPATAGALDSAFRDTLREEGPTRVNTLVSDTPVLRLERALPVTITVLARKESEETLVAPAPDLDVHDTLTNPSFVDLTPTWSAPIDERTPLVPGALSSPPAGFGSLAYGLAPTTKASRWLATGLTLFFGVALGAGGLGLVLFLAQEPTPRSPIDSARAPPFPAAQLRPSARQIDPAAPEPELQPAFEVEPRRKKQKTTPQPKTDAPSRAELFYSDWERQLDRAESSEASERFQIAARVGEAMVAEARRLGVEARIASCVNVTKEPSELLTCLRKLRLERQKLGLEIRDPGD